MKVSVDESGPDKLGPTIRCCYHSPCLCLGVRVIAKVSGGSATQAGTVCTLSRSAETLKLLSRLAISVKLQLWTNRWPMHVLFPVLQNTIDLLAIRTHRKYSHLQRPWTLLQQLTLLLYLVIWDMSEGLRR